MHCKEESLKVKYDTALLRSLLVDPSLETQLQQQEKRRAILRNMLEKRRRFLVSNFPESIRRAVDIMYSTEMNRVVRAQTADLDESARRLRTKRCFLRFCDGFCTLLNGKWCCGKCQHTVCPDCERFFAEDHVCHDDDRASVQWIARTLTTCPSCNRPIEKDGGCDYVTCVCGSNLRYSTGEKSDQGNHGQTVLLEKDRLVEGITGLKRDLIRGRGLYELSDEEMETYQRLVAAEMRSSECSWSSDWTASGVLKNIRSEQCTKRSAEMVSKRVQEAELQRQERRALVQELHALERLVNMPT